MSLLVTFVALLFAVWVFMTGGFVLAKLSNRADLVDSAWGVGFVYVAWLSWILGGRHFGIKLLAALCVSLWGLRIFLHISLRNRHKPEDHRYGVFRQKWGNDFWSKAYTNIFLLQGALIVLISTSVVAIMLADRRAALWLSVVGFVVWLFGIGFETVADWQLQQFVRTKKPGQIMQRGLWRYSRHPNYFGEITAWWGAALVAVSFGQWWGIIGVLVITFLIIKVSGIPPLEKHYADNPAFQKYKKHTSVLLPLPAKGSK